MLRYVIFHINHLSNLPYHTLPLAFQRSLVSHVSIKPTIIKAMVDNRHSLSPLILVVLERAEGNSLVMLFTMYFETTGATGADSVVLKV